MAVTIALFKNCISQFRVSALRHFGTPVVKCFDTSTPGIRNSEMESDQRSGTPAFLISVNRHFGIPVVKFLDSPCRGARNSETELVCDISRLRVSRFRDSSDEESLLLTPPTPGIRNSGMESLSFLDFGFRDFGTPYDESLCHFHLPVSEIPVSSTPSDAPVSGFRISALRDS
jgi:hypothetical protein